VSLKVALQTIWDNISDETKSQICPKLSQTTGRHTTQHRRTSSVNFRAAQSFCLKNVYEKLTKCANFR